MSRGRLVALAYVAIAVALIAARPAPTPGPVARDFEAYWSAGTTWNAHADPYSRAIWRAEQIVPGVDARHDELLPFIDPPATLLVWSVAARMPYAAAAVLWTCLLVVAVLVLVIVSLAAAGERVAIPAFLAGLALAIAFGPISSDLALGQLALPAFVAAALFVVFADRSVVGAAAAATFAFAQPNVSLGIVTKLGANRARLAAALAVIAAYALGVVTSGWQWPLEYFRAVSAHGAAERFAAIQITPAAIAYAFGATPYAAQLLGIVFAVLALAAAVAIVVAVSDPLARFAACSALVPFVVAFVHEHDLAVAYPAAVWCAVRARAGTRAIALTGTFFVSVDWLGLAQRPAGIVQSALLAAAAAIAFVSLRDARHDPASWRALALAAAVFVTAAWVGTSHPTPVWPAALGGFRAPTGASAAGVWLAEQRANGLLAAVPAWGFLRALSLLGCALLSYAICRHSAYRRTA